MDQSAPRVAAALISLGLASLLGCGPEDSAAVAAGARLAADPSAAGSANGFACTTCHADGDGDPRLLPGASLAGVTARGSWWLGETDDLLDAVNHCVTLFLRGGAWARDDGDARGLLAWMASLDGRVEPVDWSPPAPVARRVAAGDLQAGERLWVRACQGCHGALDTGDGRIDDTTPILPDALLSSHGLGECGGLDINPCGDQPSCTFEAGRCRPSHGADDALGDKVRQGRFGGLGGRMPFFAVEVLGEEALDDLATRILAGTDLAPVVAGP